MGDIDRASGVNCTTSANKITHLVILIGDSTVLTFQYVGDLDWQDIQQQHFGLCLEQIFLIDEVVKHRKDNTQDAANIQHIEECDHRRRQGDGAARGLQKRAAGEQDQEDPEPTGGGSKIMDDKRAQGTKRGPEDYDARIVEAAQTYRHEPRQ
jgi:hypothetical protein